jgi:thiamine biosynthesis protein ThiS
MEIYLNSESKSVADNLTLSNLIKDLSLENKRFAVEVNLNIIPRSQFEQFKLKNQDKVEIVQAIGGG